PWSDLRTVRSLSPPLPPNAPPLQLRRCNRSRDCTSRRSLFLQRGDVSNFRRPGSAPAEAKDRIILGFRAGNFVAKEEMTTEPAELHDGSAETAADEEGWVPRVDMVFENDEKAYLFYCLYGMRMGFGVRKHLVKRRSSGSVYCRVFSCYKEGFCRSLKEGKKPKPNARSGCQAHMTIRILDNGGFRVSEFEPQHNHDLAPEVPLLVTDSTSGSDTTRKAGDKNALKQAMVRRSLANFVPLKSINATKVEDLGTALRYMQRRVPETRCGYSSTKTGEAHHCIDDAQHESLVPKVDLEFEDDEEAYLFYINYATSIGFSVRKHLVKRRASGVVYSRTYVCHKEGFRRKKDEQRKRCPKPYDRTGCLASMTIKITKNGRYRVSEFMPKHNHPLVIPSKAHLFRWRWRRGMLKSQADLVDLDDEFGAVSETMEEQIDAPRDSCRDPTFTSVNCKNYIPSKRTNDVRIGDVGAMMQYFHEKQIADPSFYYALQLDRDDQIANVFWTDAKSIVDFEYFGDVVCFDTSYKTSDYGRPFAPFIGVNHHKQAIIFGAAMLYDETEESFKWLFQTFKDAMNGKQPKVILTGQSKMMSNALAATWPGTTHRLCVWQLYNDATMYLNFIFQGSKTFSRDFSKCIYDYEDEEEFLSGWQTLLQSYDLHANEWLASLYEDRKKWALPYERQMFCADMTSTLVSENMNSELKEYLDPKLDLLDFFKRYEEIVDKRRDAELEYDIHAHQCIPKLPFSRMLRQAANMYTPAVYKTFQTEFELSMDCMVYCCGQEGTMFRYKVTIEDKAKEYIVEFDSSNGTVACSCKRFEFVGIHCRHVLKTLDVINIKELPPHYILKRWTKDAKVTNLHENHGIAVNGENRSTVGRRYSSLCSILNKIAVRAAENLESYMFIESLSGQLMDQIHQIMQTATSGDPDDG
ncbi:unnamed protein product, partial [Musa acuminata subsp. burmannicoides]